MKEKKPAAYPPEWNVKFDSAGPLVVAPPPPFDAKDDGNYRQPYWTERFTGFAPGTKEYPAGFVTHEGGPRLAVPLRKDQDTAITLRDGTVIYADIFRAANAPADAKLPTLLAWSPYGKTTPKNVLSWKRYFMPVNATLVSGFAQVEGPDPAFWTQHGYALVNVDHRGVNKSGGDIHWWGAINAYDSHDVVNWIAAQPWSNGKVGMTGVSWLGIQQWYAATNDPPEALAAISPRSHMSDMLREFMRVGGISRGASLDALIGTIAPVLMGEHQRERVDLMSTEQPLDNAYWQDKRAKLGHLRIPVYQVAGPAVYSSAAFPFIPEGRKWLRLAPSYHLDDYYKPEALSTEKRFFDRYLKGTDNGWEKETPTVQIEVMEPPTPAPGKLRQAKAWPVENTKYKKLYLDNAQGALVTELPSAETPLRYDGTTGKVSFAYTFTEDTEVTGFLKVKLWLEAEGASDADVFVSAVKALGPARIPVGSGQLRASLRELDRASTDWLPIPSLRAHQPLKAGEVVPLEISLRATFLVFRKGEQLVLEIGSTPAVFPPFPPGAPPAKLSDTDSSNSGQHVLRSGATRDSYLQIPTLPPL